MSCPKHLEKLEMPHGNGASTMQEARAYSLRACRFRKAQSRSGCSRPARVQSIENVFYLRLDGFPRRATPSANAGHINTMSAQQKLQAILDAASISPEIFTLRPDYRALLLIVDGITPEPSNAFSESLLQEVEASARAALAQQPVTELSHIAAWREAFKAFGAKPNKFRNSLEALTRRAEKGLPRVNRLTDVYNAVSVKHQIPLGGEDLAKYVGPPRLKRGTGEEKFEVNADGKVVTELAEQGEVVWCDDEGVTCRRWNWRQRPRTALSDETTGALFILDALSPLTDDQVEAVGDELVEALRKGCPNAVSVRKMLKA